MPQPRSDQPPNLNFETGINDVVFSRPDFPLYRYHGIFSRDDLASADLVEGACALSIDSFPGPPNLRRTHRRYRLGNSVIQVPMAG